MRLPCLIYPGTVDIRNLLGVPSPVWRSCRRAEYADLFFRYFAYRHASAYRSNDLDAPKSGTSLGRVRLILTHFSIAAQAASVS